MKSALSYEIAATILALLGALSLVGLYMPILNPGLTTVETHHELPSVGYYIILTPIPMSILVAAWFLNMKAQAIRRGNEKHPHVPQSALERKLKWVVAGVVIVLVAIAFLC